MISGTVFFRIFGNPLRTSDIKPVNFGNDGKTAFQGIATEEENYFLVYIYFLAKAFNFGLAKQYVHSITNSNMDKITIYTINSIFTLPFGLL